MMKGRVKFFSNSKGYGFISPDGAVKDDKSGDVFVHYSSVIGDGYKSLTEGDEVEFEVEQTEKGKKATNVRKVVNF